MILLQPISTLFPSRRSSDLTVRFAEAKGVLKGPIAHGWTLAVGAADLNGDLLPEIYIANDHGPDRLLLNRSSKGRDRKSTRLNSSHVRNSYAVFCLKKKNKH